MIRHHPPLELLVEYATGAAVEPIALATSCHLACCEDCRGTVASLEMVGGALLDEIEPLALADSAWTAMERRLDEAEAPARPIAAVSESEVSRMVPPPLRPYVRSAETRTGWRRMGRWFEELRLPVPVAGFKTALMRLDPGSIMPVHSHRGREYTLVLAGGFHDGEQHFLPGDFALRDASDRHQPIVDVDGGCLCLVVLDAPLRFTGAIGRLINPFLRI
jgi:putative transcriptional regulator